MTTIGRSPLSRPPAWDPRWRSNLWPSCSLWVLPMSPWLFLTCWTCANLATRHTRTHGGERSLSPACYLPFFLFRTDKHAGREIARRHMAAWPHVLENQLPDSLLTAQEGVCLQGGLLAWEWMQGFDFHTWDPPPIFSVLLGLVCVTAPSFLFDLHLLFLFFLDVRAWVRLGARSHDCFGFKHWRLRKNWQRTALLHMAVPLMKQYLS